MKENAAFLLQREYSSFVRAVPGAEVSVHHILATRQAERKQQRVKEFLYVLSKEVDEKFDEINQQFLREDDFLDLFELTLARVATERKASKRILYKNILLNGMVTEKTSFDDIEQCVRLVENLTEANVFLLRVLTYPEQQNQSLGQPVRRSGNMSTTTLSRLLQLLMPGWEGGSIRENLVDLEFLGLINPISNSFQDMVTANGLSPVLNSLTLKGERIVRYLR